MGGHSPGNVRDGKTEVPGAGDVVPGAGDVAEYSLEQSKIDFYRFKEAPLESNRIWIADKPLEEWLEGFISASQCGTACGDSICRTLEVDGESYEAIPPELIVKAGLLASAELLKGEPQSGGCSSGACSSQPVSAGCGCGA